MDDEKEISIDDVIQVGPQSYEGSMSLGDLLKVEFQERKPGPVELSDRQGVWMHHFKCLSCYLEFLVYSWVPDRHNLSNTYCPECGETLEGRGLHRRTNLSDSKEFIPFDPTEIANFISSFPVLWETIEVETDKTDI